MNDVFEILVFAFAVALMFAMPFAFFAFVRYLRYKETVALAERGLLRPSRRQRSRTTDTLRWGLLTFFIGLAFTLSLLTIGIGPWLMVGLIPMFVGIAFITIHIIGERESVDESGDGNDIDAIPPHKQ